MMQKGVNLCLNRFQIGGVLKTKLIFLISVILACIGMAQAQSPDSLIISSANAPPGGTVMVTVSLHNTQYPVSGFSTRFVLSDSINATFVTAEASDEIEEWEHFDLTISDGTCRMVGLANLPGGGDPPPLSIGLHELAEVHLIISNSAPWGSLDTVYFADDDLPPERDNSISDSTGYINEVPTLIPGVILFDIFQDAGDSPGNLPKTIELRQNYPNPFNGETIISFDLPYDAGEVSIDIYDMVGRLVKTYALGGSGAGHHSVIWNGEAANGLPVASGIYFYRLTVDSAPVTTRRMTLLK
jgi:hypothetical protein